MWRKARFEVKMYKAHHSRNIFGSSDVDVARSTFRSQKRQKPEGFGALLGAQMS